MGLSKNTKLSSISFSGTQLGDAGFKDLAPALAASRLNFINLSDTGLTSASGRSQDVPVTYSAS
jgi:hypothetical protein